MTGWLINPLRLGVNTPEFSAKESSPVAAIRLPVGRQLALYGTLVFGNFASNFLEAYRSGMPWRPDILSLVFASIVGLVLLPGAIDTSKLNGEKEELVQFAMVFTYGMGWQTLLGAAIQAASAM
jgi:hypothetical protein